MTRISLLMALCVPLVALADARQSTKSVLSEYFRFEQQAPRVEKNAKTMALEICFDTCDYYRARSTTAESDLWDLAFVHQYYFNDPNHLEQFRARYAAVARETLEIHAEGCPTGSEKRLARCVVLKLADRIGAYYAFVRYDEGSRCQITGRLTDPSFQGKSSCRRLK
jgi:hypothetical protein